jgi:hypothetical protein
VILGIMHSKDVSMGTPLLARGRDRLETLNPQSRVVTV